MRLVPRCDLELDHDEVVFKVILGAAEFGEEGGLLVLCESSPVVQGRESLLSKEEPLSFLLLENPILQVRLRESAVDLCKLLHSLELRQCWHVGLARTAEPVLSRSQR